MGAIAYASVSPALTAYQHPHVPKHPFKLARAAAMLATDGSAKGLDGILQKNSQLFATTL